MLEGFDSPLTPSPATLVVSPGRTNPLPSYPLEGGNITYEMKDGSYGSGV